MIAELGARLHRSAKEICAFLAKQRFSVSYAPHGLAKYLVRLGFCYKKSPCVPAKADEAAQQAFHREVLAPLMAAASDDNPLYFVDAIHPSHTGQPAFGWMRKGDSKALPSNHGRSNRTINGALSWPNKTFAHREETVVSADAMIALFGYFGAPCAQAMLGFNRLRPKTHKISKALFNLIFV